MSVRTEAYVILIISIATSVIRQRWRSVSPTERALAAQTSTVLPILLVRANRFRLVPSKSTSPSIKLRVVPETVRAAIYLTARLHLAAPITTPGLLTVICMISVARRYTTQRVRYRTQLGSKRATGGAFGRPTLIMVVGDTIV